MIEGDELGQLVCGGACIPGPDHRISLKVTDSHGASAVATTTLRIVADFDLLLGGQAMTIVPGQSNSSRSR